MRRSAAGRWAVVLGTTNTFLAPLGVLGGARISPLDN